MRMGSFSRNSGILIVDDHTISRYFILESLRIFSCDINHVKTACEAISITINWFPTLIYTDIHLPDKNGFSMLQEIIQAWPQKQNLPHIVIVTGDRSSRLKQRAKQINVAELLLKPVTMDEIRASAQRLMPCNSTVQENSVKAPTAAMDHALRELFSRELNSRLPVLDRYISQLDWKPACDILHQLIASSALCREKELENCSRLLYRVISKNPAPSRIAQAYHPFLQAASRTKMRL